MVMIKVGDRIRYTPVIIKEDSVAEGEVKMYEPASNGMFRMDMLAIDEVPHWIPAHECVLVESRSAVFENTEQKA